MTKQAINAGNTMMMERILQMPVQPYQDGVYVYRIVETRGRKTGQARRVPIAVFQYQGQRYLVAPNRGRDWVHNLIASNTCTLITQTEQEQCHATLTFDDEAITAVQVYKAKLEDWALRQFPFPRTASVEEMRANSEGFAVFRLS